MPALLDMQINKQQIHIMAATEKADHTVALSLSLGKVEIVRVRDLKQGSEEVCG